MAINHIGTSGKSTNHAFAQNLSSISVDTDLTRARESRHEIFHTKSYEVTDDQLNTYIEEMIDVLQDTKCLASYPDAQQAVEELKRLKANQIYISEEDASAVMDIALEAVRESKHEAISEIENARALTIYDIDSKQGGKQIDEETRLTKRQELRAHIIEYYGRYYSTTDISPLVQSKKNAIDELYTPLVILNENQKWDFKEIEHLYERSIFFLEDDKYVDYFIRDISRYQRKAFFNNGSMLHNVFLTGEAGFGKTTLCKKLLSVWCNMHKSEELSKPALISIGQDWNLDFFQFVFYICLRDTNKESSLEEMVKRQLLPAKYHDTFEEILEHVPEKCLFICDGLDEWNPPEGMPKVPRTSPGLPLRKSKSNYVTLFTARSWKLDNIRLSSGEVDAMLDIKGIVHHRELIAKLLRLLDEISNKQVTSDTFLHDVRKKEKLQSLMKNPLVLKLIVCLWYDKQMLNESLTCVYSDIIELFLHHATMRNSRDHDFKNDARHTYTCKADICPFIAKDRPFIRKNSYLLLKLSKLAFETLFSKDKQTRLIFKTSDLSSYGITDSELNILLKIGVLSLRMVASTSVLEEKKEVAFIHSTFQEYFAACYITSRDDIRIETILRHRCICLHDIKNLETFLVFVSCMNVSTMHRISIFLAGFVNNDTHRWHRQFVLPSYSAAEISDVLFTCLSEAKCVHDTAVRIIVSDIFYPIKESELLRNVDFKETKSLVIKTQVIDTSILFYFKQLETLKDFSVDLPIQETLQIMESSQESLKYMFLRKGLQTLSNQYLAEFHTLIQSMPQLQYIALENVMYFKSMMAIDHFLKACREYKHYMDRRCFHGVYCLPHSTKLEEDEYCSIVIKVAENSNHEFTMEGSHKSIFRPEDSTHVMSLKNEIPIQWLTDFVGCLNILELVDVKMSFLSLKSIFEEVGFPNNYEDMSREHELSSCDIIYKITALCTIQLTLTVRGKIIHQLKVSDLEQQDDPEHLLSFLISDYEIENFECSSHFSHLNVFINDKVYPKICTVDCVNMKLPSLISVLSWIMKLPNTEIRMTSEHVCFQKIKRSTHGVSPTISVKFSNTSHSLIREIKSYLSLDCDISEFHLEHVFLDSIFDFDPSKVTSLILDTVTLTFETLTGILDRLKDWIYNPSITVCFSEIIVVGKGDVGPEISVEYCKIFSGQISVRRRIIVFKNILNEDISKVRQTLQLLNDFKEMLRRSFSIIAMKNLQIAHKNLKDLISGLNILCNDPVIELSKVALLDTNGEGSENVIETCSQNWLPQIHVIDENGMLSVFKEACMFRTLVCTTTENDNISHLTRLLPTCQCLEELRLLNININNMTFDFSSEMKSLQRIYLSRIKATSASLQKLLERIPMSDQVVTVYLNNVFLLDKSPLIFLNTVQEMKQVHVETFSKVKQVFLEHSFFFDDTNDNSQFFRMTVRK
ncbi:uncharacterized protein LOC123555911 [Mercenaria mercenaria]|uniref:uncharacterized protein LOC123555911 n=1 Tax=Mercenaria mercenaria TaxID=6596 RepID=UPI00234F40B4|nr:uncharacterized protein LOC123555911 [Mercenaria mercenaria]